MEHVRAGAVLAVALCAVLESVLGRLIQTLFLIPKMRGICFLVIGFFVTAKLAQYIALHDLQPLILRLSTLILSHALSDAMSICNLWKAEGDLIS